MPFNTLERLQAAHRFLHLEVDRHKQLQQIMEIAADVCQTPIVLITFLDDQLQHIRFRVGWDAESTSLEDAFCAHTILQEGVLEIPDAQLDERFVQNPLVTGTPHIRFYAGSALTTHDQHKVGSLCVLGQEPKTLTQAQSKMLERLSDQVIQILEFEMSLKLLKEQYSQVRSSQIKLKSFFDGNASLHLLLGLDFDVLAFNKVAKTIVEQRFGKTIREGDDIRSYIRPGNIPFFTNSYQAALHGQVVKRQLDAIDSDMVTGWDVSFEPAIDSEGRIIGVSMVAVDATLRLKQIQQIEQKNKALEEIAFVQSHQLRKPVATILGLMSLIKTESYFSGSAELAMLEQTVHELDTQIKRIVSHTYA